MEHFKLVNKDGIAVAVPWNEATGAQLKEQFNIAPDRVVTIRDADGKTRSVRDNERVELADGTRVSDIPVFDYGSAAPAVANRLALETAYVSALYEQQASFGYDESLGRWWMHLPAMALPKGWLQRVTPIMVTAGDQYPMVAPDGFFLSNDLRHRNGTTPDHYFERSSIHNPLVARNWAWFCIHADRGWRPTYDVRVGDSIAKYLTLIHLVLSRAA